jgi:hypothetical protein
MDMRESERIGKSDKRQSREPHSTSDTEKRAEGVNVRDGASGPVCANRLEKPMTRDRITAEPAKAGVDWTCADTANGNDREYPGQRKVLRWKIAWDAVSCVPMHPGVSTSRIDGTAEEKTQSRMTEVAEGFPPISISFRQNMQLAISNIE